MIEVVGLGQCCVDYLTVIDRYPEEDAKCEFERLLVQGGGPVATALVCLSRLGRRTAVVGRVGDDPFGEFIRRGLIAEGVDVAFLETVPGKTSQFAFIAANPNTASRTIFWTRSTAGEVWRERLPLALIREAEVLHLDGLMEKSSLAAAAMAREAGRTVVLDAGTLRPHSLELARLVDHLVVGEPFAREFAPDLPPEEAVKRLFELGPKAAVITLGGRGSVGYDGREVIRMPAFEVEVVDTTGAGDAFHGGYIHALLDGLDLEERMRIASAVAAISITALGGRTALPDERALKAFLAAGPKPA